MSDDPVGPAVGTGEASRGVALVTGGASGIGRAVAERLGRCGWSVAVGHFGQPDLAGELVETLAAVGSCAIAVEADVSDPGQVHEFVTEAQTRLGPLTAVIACAGVVSHHLLWDIPDEEFDRVISINLKGVFNTLKHCVPGMVDRRSGTVITVASELAFGGAATMSHYSASKGGVISMSKSLAKEVAGFGVRVHSIAPGPTETPMLLARPESHSAEILAEIPLGRWGQPEDVARTVEFLLGPGGAFYTGWVFSPNGGSVM